ncbi:MAG: mandelate racemase/muconate lactonizing enzyme family protein [Granulosicoccus sp.]|nr:mandelate racemase/muconate lactonizing enzyme family protein [Granulosicoccus sp.]
MTTIQSVECTLYRIPLAEVLSDAKHGDHTHFELIVVAISSADGLIGHGYTYTGGYGGQAILSMLKADLVPALIGEDCSGVEQLHEKLRWRVHYVGRGGIASFALSAIDIALWDLRCRRSEKSLWRYLDGTTNTTRVYAGGIDLNFSLEKLLAQTQGYLDRGFAHIKIKVGLPRLEDDLNRAAAVKKMIGDGQIMVDANYGMEIEQATEAAMGFGELGVLWFEEPIIPDDYTGYATIADATGTPLAMGENLHTLEEFALAFQYSKLAFIQPDASNCGGITGWLAVAEMAREAGIPICSHGMQELHVSLMASQEHAGYLEAHSFPIDEYTHRPLVLHEHLAVAPDSPGTGVEFRFDALEPFRVAAFS